MTAPALPVINRTCSGMCCAAFPVGDGMATYSGLHDGSITEVREPSYVRLKDILVPISHDEAIARLRAAGSDISEDRVRSAQHFMCNRWDTQTGLCTVYESRPDMCRIYLPEKHCSHGCKERP